MLGSHIRCCQYMCVFNIVCYNELLIVYLRNESKIAAVDAKIFKLQLDPYILFAAQNPLGNPLNYSTLASI